ncbi:MAG: DUF6941 family protein [Pirellulaceae bacterium]
MLLCDSVSADPSNRKKVTVQGLLSSISCKGKTFPVSGEFSVYLQLSECRRPGEGWIRVVDDSDEEVHRGQRFTLNFSGDPLETYAIAIRLENCVFPEPGVYFVEFVFEGNLLAKEPLLVR